MSKFTEFNANRLHKLYKHATKKREDDKGKDKPEVDLYFFAQFFRFKERMHQNDIDKHEKKVQKDNEVSRDHIRYTSVNMYS